MGDAMDTRDKGCNGRINDINHAIVVYEPEVTLSHC